MRRRTCILLSRILSILGKTTFSIDIEKFANILYLGLLELPKDSTKWSDVIASTKQAKNGMTLIILLYYHFLGTQEYEKKIRNIFPCYRLFHSNVIISILFFRNDVVSLESLIARVMLLPKSTPISVLTLKPLWLLFAVSTYLFRTCSRYVLIAFDFAGNVSISSASQFSISL